MSYDNKEDTFINCQTEICNKPLPRVKEVVYVNLITLKNQNAKNPKPLKYSISFLMTVPSLPETLFVMLQGTKQFLG